MKLDLDTQSDVSRRTAAIIFISGDSLHSLEVENEGPIQPAQDGPDSSASVGGCFVHTEALARVVEEMQVYYHSSHKPPYRALPESKCTVTWIPMST